MGKRVIMSERERARVVADRAATSPSPETEVSPNAGTIFLMMQVFGKRNLPYIPPHLQRQELAQKLKPSPQNGNNRTTRTDPAFTRHEPKPRGRSYPAPAFRTA